MDTNGLEYNAAVVEQNRRLRELVAELLRKNEVLRQQLAPETSVERRDL